MGVLSGRREVSGRWITDHKKINIYPETSVGSVSVGARKDLTDRQWVALLRVLPPRPVVGRRPKWTRRPLFNGIRWPVRVGAPWRGVPERYGHWQWIYQLFRRWQRESCGLGSSRHCGRGRIRQG
ncbi:transposase [Saccharopolyspora tripterygii]